MLLGVLPTPQLLQKYDLEVFSDISEAMKSGSIRYGEGSMKATLSCAVWLRLSLVFLRDGVEG